MGIVALFIVHVVVGITTLAAHQCSIRIAGNYYHGRWDVSYTAAIPQPG